MWSDNHCQRMILHPGKMALLAVLAVPPAQARADALPLWEVGLGGGVLQIPDYRGAQEARTYPYPFALPFYRGKYLRSDEEGVRGEMLLSEYIRFDFSLDGNVPVDSDDVPVRQGMPDLDPTFQIGPALNIKLWHSAREQSSLILFLPVRAAVTVTSPGLDHIGYTFSPRFHFYQKLPFIGGQWQLGFGAGLEFGSEDFHDFYYQVEPPFATASRPVYDAESGFAGYRSVFSLYRRFNDMWISLYGRYDRIDGAVFEDSPLVQRNEGLTLGFLVTWIVFKSETLVEETDWRYR